MSDDHLPSTAELMAAQGYDRQAIERVVYLNDMAKRNPAEKISELKVGQMVHLYDWFFGYCTLGMKTRAGDKESDGTLTDMRHLGYGNVIWPYIPDPPTRDEYGALVRVILGGASWHLPEECPWQR